jgi:hypothetical protein
MGRLLVVFILSALATSACGANDTPGGTSEGDPVPATSSVAATAIPDPTPATEPASVSEPDDPETARELFPDVLAGEATQTGDGTWTFNVTLSSPYDSPERYADAWRVLGPDADEYGVRILTHDHAAEQPFTRSVSGIAIPEEVETVTIQGRDQVSGWGGTTIDLILPR